MAERVLNVVDSMNLRPPEIVELLIEARCKSATRMTDIEDDVVAKVNGRFETSYELMSRPENVEMLTDAHKESHGDDIETTYRGVV
ncbi:hypothetical protein FE257_004096, partial [Aspergillus nanangensis]